MFQSHAIADDLPAGLPPALSGKSNISEPELEFEKENLSLEEIVNPKVSTASMLPESSLEAPAWVITITADDLSKRGYTDLSQILDDLPGMDIIRPYGATYFKNYWRGYRNTIGASYLLMIDGMPMNRLYFNEADVLAAMPITNVEKVEIVYGPDSSVYGSNAFTGIIQVFTRNDSKTYGTKLRSSYKSFVPLSQAGDINNYSEVGEMSMFFKDGELRLSLTGRFESSKVDDSNTESFEYTKDQYYENQKLWGDFISIERFGGKFNSPNDHRSLDMRLFLKGSQIGFQHYRMSSGFGYEQAADKFQNSGKWIENDNHLFFKNQHSFSNGMSSDTKLRFRTGEIDPESFDVASFCRPDPVTKSIDCSKRDIYFTHWQLKSNRYSFDQVLQSPKLRGTLFSEDSMHLSFGFSYRKSEYQKAYEKAEADPWPAEKSIYDSSGNILVKFPGQTESSLKAANFIVDENRAGFFQLKYNFFQFNTLNLGLRFDHNNMFGMVGTFRGSYILDLNPLTVKLLFGDSYQEPSPRDLYGGYLLSGSNEKLEPEYGNTWELILNYLADPVNLNLNLYFIRNWNTIKNTAGSAKNLGQRRVLGADAGIQTFLADTGFKSVKAWAYASYIYLADEQKTLNAKVLEERVDIEDLAKIKLWAGADVEISSYLGATILGRYIGKRETGIRNPVKEIPEYYLVDASIYTSDIIMENLRLFIKVKNLFDQKHFHPGIRSAGSGEEPGSFDENGQWQGSKDIYNSKMPQHSRTLMFAFELDF